MYEVLEPGDLMLAEAIRATSRILVPVAADLRKAAEAGPAAFLIEYLRSNKPLSSGDRDYLADLIQGVISRPPGRREITAEKRERRETERRFKHLRGEGIKPAEAWTLVAEQSFAEFGDGTFARLGFKPRNGDVADLAEQMAEWSKRPASRKK